VSGQKLAASCSACAAQVCGVDPYCCNTWWDSICVGRANSTCAPACQ
jgi:hypothetical protein